MSEDKVFLDIPPWEGRERGQPGNPHTKKELTTKACGESPAPAITCNLNLNKEMPKQSDSDRTRALFEGKCNTLAVSRQVMPCPGKCLKVTLKESRALLRENHPDYELQEKPLDTPYPSDISHTWISCCSSHLANSSTSHITGGTVLCLSSHTQI